MKLKDARLYVLARHPDGRVDLATPEAVIIRRIKQTEADRLIAYVARVVQAAESEAKEQRTKANNQNAHAASALEGALASHAREQAQATADLRNAANEINQLRSQLNRR